MDKEELKRISKEIESILMMNGVIDSFSGGGGYLQLQSEDVLDDTLKKEEPEDDLKDLQSYSFMLSGVYYRDQKRGSKHLRM